MTAGFLLTKELRYVQKITLGKLTGLVIVAYNPLENISKIRKVSMVFKDGAMVDLNLLQGTASYWNYYITKKFKEGYLAEAEESAGFKRGKVKAKESILIKWLLRL